MVQRRQRGLPQLDQSQDPERDALIVKLRDEDNLTFKAIGEVFGLTRQRTTQLYDRATAPPAEPALCWCGAALPRVPGGYQRQGGRPSNPAKYCTPEHILVAPGPGSRKPLRARTFMRCYHCHTEYDAPRKTSVCSDCSAQARTRVQKVNYAQLAEAQEHLCAICNSPETAKTPSGKPRRLALDHCHTSNEIRKLLCLKCNTLIGAANESLEILEAAAAYLRKHQLSDPM